MTVSCIRRRTLISLTVAATVAASPAGCGGSGQSVSSSGSSDESSSEDPNDDSSSKGDGTSDEDSTGEGSDSTSSHTNETPDGSSTPEDESSSASSSTPGDESTGDSTAGETSSTGEDSTGETTTDIPTGEDYDCMSYLDLSADISDIAASFNEADWFAAVTNALDRRYPSGSWIARSAKSPEETLGGFLFQKDSLESLTSSMGFGIHEVTHTFTQDAGWDHFQYMVGAPVGEMDNQQIIVSTIEGFPRKEVLSLLPDDVKGLTYTKTYLEDSGEMDLESTMDEFNAYTHHLYGDWAFLDLRGQGSRQSSLDGLSCFMLYLEIYLHLARTQHEPFYNELKANDEMRELVLLFWDRAMCLVQQAKDIPSLQMDADKALAHVFEAKWLEEIAMLRE